MVIELTAARDLRRFIESFAPFRQRAGGNPLSYATIRAASADSAKIREFTGHAPEVNHFTGENDHLAERLKRP
jgi:hypothetical protein